MLQYRLTKATIDVEINPSLTKVFTDLKNEYGHILKFDKQEDSARVTITGPIESITNFLCLLGEEGGTELLKQNSTSDTQEGGAELLLKQNSTSVPESSHQPISTPISDSQAGISQYSQSVYDNMSSDALALLKKLPIGMIKGVHYDPSAGRVLIDKETPQLEEERISKFQEAYQSITGKKLKIVTVPVPPSASPDAVATLVHHYNTTYDQCVFTQQEGLVKIISASTRQIDQARTLLSEDIRKSVTSVKQANEKFEVIHLSTDRTLTLKKADLIKEEVDIIVNPANKRLLHAGGVAAALNRASKGNLQKYSDRHVQTKGTVPVGGIAITLGGGALKCSKVIHAVGPERSKCSEADCERYINRVVLEVLKGAERHNANSLSFPAISTGIFGVKKELVARCVVETIIAFHFTKASPVLSDIRIVIIDEETYAPFARYIQQKQKPTGATKDAHRSLTQLSKQQSEKENPTSTSFFETDLDAKKSITPSTSSASTSLVIQTPGKAYVVYSISLNSIAVGSIHLRPSNSPKMLACHSLCFS